MKHNTLNRHQVIKTEQARIKRRMLSILRQASVINHFSPNRNVSESNKEKKKKKEKQRSNCHVNSI